MDRNEIKARIQRLDALPTLPAVLVRLLDVTCDETSSAEGIARIVETDQTLTAQLLRIVNSPAYGFSSSITTVQRAVATMGLNAVRCTALGIGVARLFPKDRKTRALCYREFWKHSLACAVCARELSRHSSRSIDKDEAFVAGLLHDIGKLALSTCAEDEFDQAVEAAAGHDLALIEAEQEFVGATHCDVGKWIAERWGLPDIYTQSIWLHHQPSGALGEGEFHASYIYVVQLADAVVRQLMIGDGGNRQFVPVNEALLKDAGITEAAVDETRQVIVDRVQDYASVVDLDLEAHDLYVESIQKANAVLLGLSVRSEVQGRRLSRREKRLRALHEMNAKLGSKKHEGEVLEIVSESLRDGFEVATGACYVTSGEPRVILGRAWQRSGPLRPFQIDADLEGEVRASDAPAEMDPTVRGVLIQAIRRLDDHAWRGSPLQKVMRQSGLMVVPMVAGGTNPGQVIVDLRLDEHEYGEQELDDLLAFASAAGIAISRVRLFDSLTRRSEELATAIWKKEQAHRQLLHSERLAAVGKMAAGAAHEINNPLAIISGRAQMMMQKLSNPNDAKQMEMIVDQCQRASKILNDLMRFARPALPKKEVIGINSIVYEVVGMFESRFERHGINLDTRFDNDLPRVLVDKGQIQQVLVNLIINAEHAITAPGEIVVSTSLSANGREICVSVADTGCGISRENLRNIFEPFFTTKEEGKGTGLGLSLAHGIVTSHQGTIQVQSEEGKGSVFTLRLPVADELDAVSGVDGDAAGRAQNGAPARRRVLVVDDEDQVREVIRETLTTAGYDVMEASNGVDALALLKRANFDLITLDIRMPRMDGMGLLRAVREFDREIPVIIVTGLAMDEEVEAARRLGVTTFIRKPFQVIQLVREVEAALPVHA